MKEDEFYMQIAYELALKSYGEDGCPIGAVLVDNNTGEILGKGHNSLYQEGNPIIHGEMAAIRDAGRMKNRHQSSLYTTLSPCFMCSGAIVQFGIPRVVIGDSVNSARSETLEFLKGHNIELVLMNGAVSKVAKACIELVFKFRNEKPELWLEDWGG